MSLHSVALVAFREGDYAMAQRLQEQSLAIRRELGDRRGIAMALGNLGNTVAVQGEYARARLLQEESLEIRKVLGDRRGIALSLSDLGYVVSEQGDHVHAQGLYRESLSISWPLGDRLCVAEALEGLAASLDEPSRASILWGGAERLRQGIDAPIPQSQRARHDARVAKARTASGEDAAFDTGWRRGRTMTIEQIIEYALEPD